MENFSHRPLSVSTITDTTSFVTASNGQVVAVADANANFVSGIPQPFASNFSSSTVSGNGNSYFGQADSFAAVIGYNFFVGGGETFSFNFKAGLNLATSIDNSQFESAVAGGSIVLELYDTTNANNWVYLDSFTLTGGLTTVGNDDFLNVGASDSITLNSKTVVLNSALAGKQESTEAFTQGSYARTFNNFTNLALVEAKQNRAAVAVPEPSNIIGTILGFAIVGYKFKRSLTKNS